MTGVAVGSLRAALFDFDGTVADSLDGMLAIYNELAQQLGVVQVGPARAQALRKLGPRAAIRELDIPMWRVPRILSAVRRTWSERAQVAEPFAGMLQTLARLSEGGVKTGVLSSNTEANVRAFFAHHGCAQPSILSTGVSMFGKASRLRKVLARHALSAAQVAYVGDEVRDMEASKTAGVRSIAVSWGYGEREALRLAGPDALVDAPEELLALFSG
jgi:phosphoglycolate phosphatase